MTEENFPLSYRNIGVSEQAEESDESEDETAGERTRKGESGKNARWHEGRCENW